MPQHEALAAMNETDYVLLINHDPLNVRRQVLRLRRRRQAHPWRRPPRGEARRLLEELRAGWWADIHDVEGIRQLFVDAAARGNSLLGEFQPDLENIAQYERKVLAQRYAVLLQSIVRRQNGVGSKVPAVEAGGEAR